MADLAVDAMVAVLANPAEHLPAEVQQAIGSARRIHQQLVLDGPEGEANAAWTVQQFGNALERYVRAFHEMKKGDYYTGWCSLEQAEIALHHLRPHAGLLPGEIDRTWLGRVIEQFQALFPYTVFLSPSYIVRKRECTICGGDLHPLVGCGHVVGKLYGGRMCSALVKEPELLEVSIVTNPLQKYSVAFPGGKNADFYDYSLVERVVRQLATPFMDWALEESTRSFPLERFGDLTSASLCPCRSGRRFGECCQPTGSVELPQIQVTFMFEVQQEACVDDLLFNSVVKPAP
jgi:hypothetical protein